MQCTVRLVTRPWPGTGTYVVVVVIILMLAWLASPAGGIPLTLAVSLASIAAGLTGIRRASLPGAQ